MTDLENLFPNESEKLKKQIQQHLENDDTDALNIINKKFTYKVEYRFKLTRTRMLTDDGFYATDSKEDADNFRKLDGCIPSYYNIQREDCFEDGTPYCVTEDVLISDLAIKNPLLDLKKVILEKYFADAAKD